MSTGKAIPMYSAFPWADFAFLNDDHDAFRDNVSSTVLFGPVSYTKGNVKAPATSKSASEAELNLFELLQS